MTKESEDQLINDILYGGKKAKKEKLIELEDEIAYKKNTQLGRFNKPSKEDEETLGDIDTVITGKKGKGTAEKKAAKLSKEDKDELDSVAEIFGGKKKKKPETKIKGNVLGFNYTDKKGYEWITDDPLDAERQNKNMKKKPESAVSDKSEKRKKEKEEDDELLGTIAGSKKKKKPEKSESEKEKPKKKFNRDDYFGI